MCNQSVGHQANELLQKMTHPSNLRFAAIASGDAIALADPWDDKWCNPFFAEIGERRLTRVEQTE
jgi:hypothetical protein